MENRLFTKKERQIFERICKLSQAGILTMMKQYLQKYYKDITINDNYIIAFGDIPVGLLAHADTVFTTPPSEFFYDTYKNIMWSPEGLGADDRAGIFAIMKIISLGYRPHVIITTNEEQGCIGAGHMIADLPMFPNDLGFLIQLDRRGTEDSVFYDCCNKEFEDYINTFGFTSNHGSFSDISVVAPVWGVSAVNLSVGYLDEHSYSERLNPGVLKSTISKVCNILTDVKSKGKDYQVFEYIENKYLSWNKYYNASGSHYEKCDFCTCYAPDTDLIYVNLTPEKQFALCNVCYAENVEAIEWCAECGRGWFLSKSERLEKRDPHTWKCKYCRESNYDSV